MSEQYNAPTPQKAGWFDPGPANVQAIYILYLAGFVVGITAIVGLVMAYMNRGRAGAGSKPTTPGQSAHSGSVSWAPSSPPS